MSTKRFCAPRQIPELYPHLFTMGSFRWLLFNRDKNGLNSAITRIGNRRLVIDIEAFEEWLSSHPVLEPKDKENEHAA